MTRTRIVTKAQVMAAQMLVEFADEGFEAVDDFILAVANAERIPGTRTYRAVYEYQPA